LSAEGYTNKMINQLGTETDVVLLS